MNNKIFLSLAGLGVFLISSSGCAFTDVNLDLPYQVANTSNWENENNIILLHPIEDNRRFKHRIGMKKNGFGMDTADVLSRQNVLGWLQERMAKELNSAGFKVVYKKAEKNGTEITGTLLFLFTEPVMQFSTVDFEGDISLLLHLEKDNGLIAEKKYYVKDIQSEYLVLDFEKEFALVIKNAADQLMVKVVNDIIELLGKYK